MPLWRCPHCATPQPEAARCWVCRRSTTSCGSCRHFRRSVASGLGFCGLDRNRLALRGDELRACWTARPDAPPPGDPAAAGPGDPARGNRRPGVERRSRTFVPVEELERAAQAPVLPDPMSAPVPSAGASRVGGGAEALRWSLWGDVEG